MNAGFSHLWTAPFLRPTGEDWQKADLIDETKIYQTWYKSGATYNVHVLAGLLFHSPDLVGLLPLNGRIPVGSAKTASQVCS